ncbi:hypothetical protein [Amycolatopsis sp. NPDC051716]|uniref:hypothetical protein n=1 Tax=Amycolatopsis sp. NPDC051716 TaxID=3155804 RepID=UPI003428BBA7
MTDEFDDEFTASAAPQVQPVDLDAVQETLGIRPSRSTIGGALILAQIRAVGHAPATASADALMSASAAATQVDRRLIEISRRSDARRRLVLGWADGAGPDPDQHPSAPPSRLSPIPYLVWGVCLAAAWPHAAAEPYPGQPFRRTHILQTCVDLGAYLPNVVTALDRTLPQAGLITFSAASGRLGPAAAALPSAVWSALRRVHDRLPHAALDRSTSVEDRTARESDEQEEPLTARRLPGPCADPAGPIETTVRAAVTALEIAQRPVSRSDLPALADPAIRRATEEALAGCGRTLISTPDGGWTTGYVDHIAQALAAEQTGTLTHMQRAVLALILLRTVAIPRAQGRHHHGGWTGTDHPTTLDELDANRRLSRTAITDALRGLRAAGYVTTTSSGGYVPGSALARLSPAAREALWEDLVILGRPNGYMAEKIRSRRHDAATATHHGFPSVDAAGKDQT